MSPRNSTKEILVVDDDNAVRWSLNEALQSWGFTPIEAGTVSEGTKLFNSHLPAAVLLVSHLKNSAPIYRLSFSFQQKVFRLMRRSCPSFDKL